MPPMGGGMGKADEGGGHGGDADGTAEDPPAPSRPMGYRVTNGRRRWCKIWSGMSVRGRVETRMSGVASECKAVLGQWVRTQERARDTTQHQCNQKEHGGRCVRGSCLRPLPNRSEPIGPNTHFGKISWFSESVPTGGKGHLAIRRGETEPTKSNHRGAAGTGPRCRGGRRP